jgi:hypothetical protein
MLSFQGRQIVLDGFHSVLKAGKVREIGISVCLNELLSQC